MTRCVSSSKAVIFFLGSISLGIARELVNRRGIAHSDLVLDAEEESSE